MVFCDCCKERDLDPLQVSVGDVVELMLHCHEEAYLVCLTIEGHRTAISHTIKAVSGQDLGKDSHLLVCFPTLLGILLTRDHQCMCGI